MTGRTDAMSDEGIALLREYRDADGAPTPTLWKRVDKFLAQHAPATITITVNGVEVPDSGIAEFAAEYEFYGEDADGREGYYTPNERERMLIEDALRNWEAQGRADAVKMGEALAAGGAK